MASVAVINRCAYCGGKTLPGWDACRYHADLLDEDPHYVSRRTAEIDALIAECLKEA